MNRQIAAQSFLLAHASLRVRYRQTFAGFLWVILNPLVLLAAQGIIFSQIFKIHILDYIFYFATGLFPWFFLSQTIDMGTSQLRSQSTSIKSYFIQPSVFNLALTLENLLNFFATMVLVMLPILVYEGKPLWIFFFWFLSTIPLAIAAASITFVLSSSQVVYRDIRFIVTFMLSVTYFLTPIFYKIELLPKTVQSFISINPIHTLLLPFQIWALDSTFESWFVAFLKSSLLAIILFGLSRLHWKRIKNSFFLNL